VLSVGKKVHSSCYNCAFCGNSLQKATCKLKDEKLCCSNCMMKKQGSSNSNNSNSNGNNLSTRDQRSSSLAVNSSTTSTTSSSSSSATKSPRRQSVGTSSSGTSNSDSKFSTAEEAELEEDGDLSELKSPTEKKTTSRDRNNTRKVSKVGQAAPLGKIEWKKGELIGKGSFGKVYMAMNSATGELIAVKQVKLSTSEEQEQAIAIQNEIALMENLRHPNIVSLLGTQRNGNKLNILMEYVPGKSLDSLLEKFGAFSEKVIRSYTKQLLEALSYCHANRVVHRDIKGKNILIDTKGNLKLADFGSAKRFTNVMSKDAPSLSYNYTPLWTAPEVLVGDYNSKVDVWSLGCVIIEMASAKPPWSEQNFENPFRALYHIGNSDSIPKIPEQLSDIGKEFVLTTLRRDPDKRPSAEECLSHEWLQGLEDLNDDNGSGSDDDGNTNNNRTDDSDSADD
jgi:serine/threonine protein kinase